MTFQPSNGVYIGAVLRRICMCRPTYNLVWVSQLGNNKSLVLDSHRMEDSGAGMDRDSGRRTDKRMWTRDEDELLIALVRTHGPGKWNRIAAHIDGRTALSCRSRWVNHLDPLVDKSPFREEENQRLLELHGEHGNKWSTFVSFFPGRTDSQLKNQYHALAGSRVSDASRLSSRRVRPGVCPDPRYMELHRSGRLCAGVDGSEIPNGDQGQGEKVSGGSLRSNSGSGKTKVPRFNGESSSNPGGDPTWFVEPVSDLSRNGCYSFGSMISAAQSAATSGLRPPVGQPRGGINAKNEEFIDFMGVGKTE